MTEITCVVVHIENPADEKALNVVLNKATGDWEPVALADLLAELQADGYDLDSTGFDAAEVDDLFSRVHNKDVEEDGFDVEAELEKPCFSRPGDVWHLGRHAVICGDSTLSETYEKLLEGKKANLVCTDPPYLVSLESSVGKIVNDDLNDEDGYDFLFKAFSCFREAMAMDASIYVFYATAKARVFHDAYEDAGFKVGAGLVWKKDRLVLTRTDWKYNHEPLIWGWRKDGRHRWYGDQKQTTVFEFDRIRNAREDGCGHPVQQAGAAHGLSHRAMHADQRTGAGRVPGIGVHLNGLRAAGTQLLWNRTGAKVCGCGGQSLSGCGGISAGRIRRPGRPAAEL